jgi:2,4-dienoyl-CoA reductase-like NADH-dependent reductase (Old Yellow Enzyme family)
MPGWSTARPMTSPAPARPALTDPLTLPCGVTLPNRLGRAAMTEGLADRDNEPSPQLMRMMAATVAGGSGLLLTGNAMVDRRHLERARNVVVDATTDEAALRRWAASCADAVTLVQLSHPGRQTNRFVQPHPVSPSGGPAVPLAGLFARPRALRPEEIREIRDAFVLAARRVVDAGFAGVQLHSAHGYLLSTFLDPKHNSRDDAYGGDLEGRARLLLEITERLRSVLPTRAVVAVKLDARDGATDEVAQVARAFADAGGDLVEISGGSYESPAMLGLSADGRSVNSDEESPFWSAAEAVSEALGPVPVMLTGGFRTRAGIDRALASGVSAVVGVGRPLAVDPTLATRLLAGEVQELPRPAPRITGPAPVRKLLGAAANSGWHRLQLARHGEGAEPLLRLPAPVAAADYIAVDAAHALLGRRRRNRRAALARRAARLP